MYDLERLRHTGWSNEEYNCSRRRREHVKGSVLLKLSCSPEYLRTSHMPSTPQSYLGRPPQPLQRLRLHATAWCRSSGAARIGLCRNSKRAAHLHLLCFTLYSITIVTAWITRLAQRQRTPRAGTKPSSCSQAGQPVCLPTSVGSSGPIA